MLLRVGHGLASIRALLLLRLLLLWLLRHPISTGRNISGILRLDLNCGGLVFGLRPGPSLWRVPGTNKAPTKAIATCRIVNTFLKAKK